MNTSKVDDKGEDGITDILPFVSIVIPCYNEESHIAGCLNSIITGDYPLNLMEILVVDGQSLDGTRKIIEEYSLKYPVIKLVENPYRLKPHALNIGINSAKGDVIIRMDAHALYERSYVSTSVSCLDKYNADNVGGIRRTLPGNNSIIARSIAESISNPFSAGNAIYRTGAKNVQWVDTVFGGCYRRETFEKIGLFNEALVRGQDREFNMRLKNAGGKILFVPDIICYYYPRSTLGGYIPWIFSSGLTPFFVSRLIKRRIYSWRNIIPLLFLLSLIVFPLLSIFCQICRYLFLGEVVAYLVCSLVATALVVSTKCDLRFLVSMPIIFFLTHAVYGLGSLVSFFKPVNSGGEWTRV